MVQRHLKLRFSIAWIHYSCNDGRNAEPTYSYVFHSRNGGGQHVACNAHNTKLVTLGITKSGYVGTHISYIGDYAWTKRLGCGTKEQAFRYMGISSDLSLVQNGNCNCRVYTVYIHVFVSTLLKRFGRDLWVEGYIQTTKLSEKDSYESGVARVCKSVRPTGDALVKLGIGFSRIGWIVRQNRQCNIQHVNIAVVWVTYSPSHSEIRFTHW